MRLHVTRVNARAAIIGLSLGVIAAGFTSLIFTLVAAGSPAGYRDFAAAVQFVGH